MLLPLIPCTIGRSLLPIAVGKVLLFRIYWLYIPIINDCFNERSLINRRLSSLDTQMHK